jgi:hypothetical protein
MTLTQFSAGPSGCRWTPSRRDHEPGDSPQSPHGEALPDWSAQAPAHVTRELLGRFLEDRDTRVVHDVYQATPECAVDAIRNGTFFHFWSDVVADSSMADDRPCPHCMAP